MGLRVVNSGKHIPEEFNVIIEIPAQSGPVKYEVDKDTGVLAVDRFMQTPMYYPCNYGYIPQTLSEDGDPCDVLVVTPVPLISGALVRCRALGALFMTDESGRDTKILAMPINKLAPMYSHFTTYQEMDRAMPSMLAAIKHFFEHYKDLEVGKWVKVDGWHDIEAAHQEIIASVNRYQQDN